MQCLQCQHPNRVAQEGLSLATAANHPWGVALAQRALGRIARSSGNLLETEQYLQEALKSFSAIEARFESGRTSLDLASLAHTQGNLDTALTYLNHAYACFTDLQVPRYSEQVEHLAAAYGVMLAEGKNKNQE